MGEAVPQAGGSGFLPECADELLSAVMRNTADGMALVDLDGRVIKWNASAEAVYGWSRADMAGAVLPFVPEQYRRRVLAQVRHAVSSGCVSEVAVPAQRPDGTRLLSSAAVIPLADSDGDTAGALLIVRDTHADQRFSRQRRDFAAMVSRHLTGPVHAVRGHSRLLARPETWQYETRRQEVLSALADSLEKVSRISDRLSVLSRYQFLERTGDREPVDVTDLISHIVADLPTGLVVVELELGAEPVMADASALTVALRALLDRYREDAVDLPVLVTTHSDDDAFSIQITDPSWPSEPDHGTVGRADSAEADVAMAIADGVFTAHGGTVKTMREGFGSKITLRLPTPTAETDREAT